MDDMVILDIDKERLKEIYKCIEDELSKIKLKINSKSNIYKCSNSFKFLGYKWQVINNRLTISANNKTYYRIKRHLKKLEKTDYLKYTKASGSYCGYFDVIKREEKGDFKVKVEEIYKSYKQKDENIFVIIKDGIFYKTMYDDAKIIWYLFDYKYINNCASFGTSPYNKVLLRLNELDISFIVVDKNKEIISSIRKDNNYSLYKILATKRYEKMQKHNRIHNLLDNILDDDSKYDEIYLYLSNQIKHHKL